MTDKTDFSIDSLRLDWECNRQANLAFSYGEHQADCQSDYDRSKNAVELAKAEAEMQIRGEPGRFGIGKLTEKVVLAAVLKHHEVQSAQDANITARHALDIAKAACNAIEHKKRGLEKAVSLFLAGYYAEPRFEGDDKEAVDEMRKKDLRSRSSRNRRRKSENT